MKWRQKIPPIEGADRAFPSDRVERGGEYIDDEGSAHLAMIEALREIAEQLEYMNRLTGGP